VRIRIVLLFTVTAIFLNCFPASPAFAERHAVLIGIRDYQDPRMRLKGPVNDVLSLKAKLVDIYGFSNSRITTLLDAEATRSNILDTLSQLRQTTQAGDFIFLYYSGHGTSLKDDEMGLPVGDETGALIPYDYKMTKTASVAMSQLIIGKRDIKPILMDLDQGRKLFVIFDTCFSQYTVRALASAGIPKSQDLELGTAPAEYHGTRRDPYPYRNILYISAAGVAEKAVDLPRTDYDGRAHGALTVSLLRGLDGMADSNNDGVMTYEEIYQYARRETNGHGHTPQILGAETRSLNTPVFEVAVKPPAGTPPKPGGIGSLSETLRVKLQGKDSASLTGRISALKGVKVVSETYDLLMSAENARLSLFLPGGEQLCRPANADEAVTMIGRYVKIRELLRMKNPGQQFNVWLRAGDDDGKTVFHEGDKAGFTIRSERQAYLLLLNVDSQGYVTMLMPENAASSPGIEAGCTLKTPQVGQVMAPFGMEFVKVFAFPEKPQGLAEFAGGDGVFSPTEDRFLQLMAWIQRQSGWAEALQQVVTVPRKP
jgi:hypothetical protein